MRKYDWSKDRVAEAVAEANCWFDCLARLGIPKGGCNYRTLQSKVRQYGIDTSHFNYHYAKTHNGQHYGHSLLNKTDDEIFCERPNIKRENIKREYIRRILNGKPHCELCGISNWNGRDLVFQIHHIDGDSSNQKKENLMLLCPNCHSQTDTFSNRKRKQ